MNGYFKILTLVLLLGPWTSVAEEQCRPPGFLLPDASIELAKRLAVEILAKRTPSPRETYPYPYQQSVAFSESLHEATITVHGVPPHVRLIFPQGRTFRYYTKPSTADRIVSTHLMVSGYLPYVIVSKHVHRKFFDDLTGVFLTTPDKHPRDVGVEFQGKELSFVDLTLPEHIPVLEIEPDNIFLIPLHPNYRDWVRQQYAAWKSGREVSPHDQVWLQAVDPQLIHHPVGVIPIHIVQHGKYQP